MAQKLNFVEIQKDFHWFFDCFNHKFERLSNRDL